MESYSGIWGSSNTLEASNVGYVKNINTLSNLPWLCFGGFNEVLRPEEHDEVGEGNMP